MNSSSPWTRRVALIVSHLAALALGLLLFRSNPSTTQANAKDSSVADAGTANDQATEAAARSSSRAENRSATTTKASVHLAAWKALAEEGLARPERMKASALILQGWIKEDWRAALDMTMKETPDDFVLMAEFNEAFSREPAAVWAMIEEKRYGVLTKCLLDQWQTALARSDEASLRQLATNLPEAGKQAALDLIARKAAKVK